MVAAAEKISQLVSARFFNFVSPHGGGNMTKKLEFRSQNWMPIQSTLMRWMYPHDCRGNHLCWTELHNHKTLIYLTVWPTGALLVKRQETDWTSPKPAFMHMIYSRRFKCLYDNEMVRESNADTGWNVWLLSNQHDAPRESKQFCIYLIFGRRNVYWYTYTQSTHGTDIEQVSWSDLHLKSTNPCGFLKHATVSVLYLQHPNGSFPQKTTQQIKYILKK